MKNLEVARAWANRTKSVACSLNFNFTGDTIYSYGWWPVASFRCDLGPKIIVYRDVYFSNTTSKHQSHVINAIDEKYHVIRTGFNPTDCTKDELIKEGKEKILSLYDKMNRVRTYRSLEFYRSSIIDITSNLSVLGVDCSEYLVKLNELFTQKQDNIRQ